MTQHSSRTGVFKFAENVLDGAKDLADDVLDRARDLEHDLRRALSKSVRPEHDDRARPTADSGELHRIQHELGVLQEEFSRLTMAVEQQGQAGSSSTGRSKPAVTRR